MVESGVRRLFVFGLGYVGLAFALALKAAGIGGEILCQVF